jgi:transposase
MSLLPSLGIDVAKKTFQAALRIKDKQRNRSFDNNQAGFASLTQWLAKQGVERVHVCLESTGSYSDALARYLHGQGHTVSLVNPARIKAYAGSRMIRTKNDKVDAGLIARFCEESRPAAWTPPPPEQVELQALVRHLESLNDLKQQLRNRLTDGPQVEIVLSSLRTMIKQIETEMEAVEKQIKEHLDLHPDLKNRADLIDSIKGISLLTAAKLLGEIPQLGNYKRAAEAVAYAGLNPMERQSGTSIKGKPRLSKAGNAQVRKILYFPAISALNHNPVIKKLGERLRQRGLCEMAIIGAAMRKLLHLVFGVVKTGKPFNENQALPA